MAAAQDRMFTNYKDFWPFYLRQHSKPQTRRLHYIGTALTLLILGYALLNSKNTYLLLIPVAGYGFAWVGHFVVESNKPATFKYPVWSLVSDYRMFFLWLSGRLEPELEAAGVQAGTKQH